MSKSAFTEAYAQLVGLLIETRRASGLTQVDVASGLGKPQSFVSKYERGERRLNVIEFCAVAQALGARPDQLLGQLVDRVGNDFTV